MILPGYVILIQEIDQGGDVPTFTRTAVDGETWKFHLRTHHRAHMPTPSLVVKLRLARQPLLFTHEFEALIGFRVSFHSCSYIECIAFGRPLPYPSAKLRNWPESRRVPLSNIG